MPLPGLSLLAHLDEQHALAYFRSSTICDNVSESVLRQRWKVAKQKIGFVTKRPGVPHIQEIPTEYDEYLKGVEASLRFQFTVSRGERRLSWGFKLVEIEPLLAFQFHVVQTRVDEIIASVSHPPTIEEMLHICLPHHIDEVKYSLSQEASGTFIIRSDDLNCRPLGGIVVDNEENGCQVAGIALGINTPLAQVVAFDGRYVLHNGYHRACGLHAAGASHMPCIVSEAQTYADAVSPGNTFSQATLYSATPPMVGHFKKEFAYPVKLRKLRREFRVSVVERTLSGE